MSRRSEASVSSDVSTSDEEDGEWMPFIIDTQPTAFEEFDPDQSFEANQYTFHRERLPQTKCQEGTHTISALGESHIKEDQDEIPQAGSTGRTVVLCFNCQEPGHAVANCPYPRDREAIRNNRLRYQAEKAERQANGEIGEDSGFHGRLHEHVADTERILEWIDKFKPGQPSDALKEALGVHTLDKDTHSSDNPARYPYLHNMLTWGYPPGWIATEDPLKVIKRRLRKDHLWEETEDLSGFDVDVLKSAASVANETDAKKIGSSIPKASELARPAKRWVDFGTDLFDSDHLAPFDVVTRRPLQPLYETPHHGTDDLWRGRKRSASPIPEGLDTARQRWALWQSILSGQNPPEPAVRRASVRATAPPPPPPPPPPPGPPPPLPSPPPPPPPSRPPNSSS